MQRYKNPVKMPNFRLKKDENFTFEWQDGLYVKYKLYICTRVYS